MDNNTPKIERLPSVMARTGLGRSSIYSLIASGAFVQPLKLTGGRAIGFLTSEVDAWITARAAERSKVHGG